MKKDNRDLLESLIQNRLEEALKNEDENSKAFEEAMKAIDRQLEIDKREADMQKEELKLKHDKEKEESRQQFEIEREESKQHFEVDIQTKRHEFDLEKEEVKSNLDSIRDDKNRTFQVQLEEMRQEFELHRDELNYYREKEKTELEAKKARNEMLIKGIEIAAAVLVTPLIDMRCKTTFAQMLCEFEKDYNFTTMAGKSLSGLFKFRK